MPKGYRELPTSIQAYVTVRGRFVSRTFPRDTALKKIHDWRERTRAELKYGTIPSAPKSSAFATDATTYLGLCAGMPSYQDRKLHIDDWSRAFGNRPRQTITAADIRAVLETWRTKKKHLSAGSLNRRRTALMAMFTALDGKAAPNVVKDVPRYSEHLSHQPRAHDMRTIASVIRRVPPNSLSRYRLQALHWTGWPSKLLMQIREPDIDLARKRVRLAARNKGQGMASAWVPVLPRAIVALRHLVRRRALREFSGGGLRKVWLRALEAENAYRVKKEQPMLPHIRIYDVRHSFATWAARRIRDDRALSELLRTNSIRRYTEGAAADRLAMALDELQPKHLAKNLHRP